MSKEDFKSYINNKVNYNPVSDHQFREVSKKKGIYKLSKINQIY